MRDNVGRIVSVTMLGELLRQCIQYAVVKSTFQIGEDTDIPVRWQAMMAASYSAPPDAGKLVSNGVESGYRNYTRYSAK